jgi:hypothetical protein
MAFPSSPTNGQIATVGGITYTYNSTKTAWVRTPSVGSNLSVFSTVITGSTPSTSTTSGALQVTGGIGTQGNLNVGGRINITNTTASTSTTTGALQVTGGVGVQGALYTASLNVGGKSISNDGIPSGTKMLFVQTSAPTGWTKDTTHNDKALRVVSGSASTGGSVAFTTAFALRTGSVGSTTLTAAQSGVPAHSHGITDPGHTHTQTTSTTDGASGRADASSGGTIYNNVASINSNTTGITINNNTPANAAEGHNHSYSLDFAVQYVDVIIATKD